MISNFQATTPRGPMPTAPPTVQAASMTLRSWGPRATCGCTPLSAAHNTATPFAATGNVFVDPSEGFSFNASSGTTNVPTNGIQLILNGIDVSPLLNFSGS